MSTVSDDSEVRREALESALSAHFAIERLGSASFAYLYASCVPSLVLWINAWYPLPDLVTWFAVLIWASCGCLAVSFALGAWRQRARLLAALPEAQRAARLEFTPEEPVAQVSSLLLLLSAAASSVLWAHGLAPVLITASALSIGAKAWMLLFAAALGNRYIERLA
jgi:hypothetical protein